MSENMADERVEEQIETSEGVIPGGEDVAGTRRRSSSGTDKPIVAAIDFGTTYSGYAFTFRSEYEKSAGAREIFSNRWSSNVGALLSAKAPTTALFDPEMTFHSFGYEAEEKYADLIQEKQQKEWHCFRRFKMKLHDRLILRRELEITDEAGRLFPAKKVFAESIRYLRNEVVATIEKRNPMKNKDMIHWVLTIPAIWTEPAKQFMREAATEAGIPTADLQIALEPEAAAVYCRSLPEGTLVDSQDREVTDAFRPGGSYMIVDLGGGTVDTTVHEVAEDGRLMEVRQASGGPWGGTSVDDTFYDFVVKKFGKDFIEQFRIERASEWMKLSCEFETQKRKLKYDTNYNIKIEIPQRLIAESNLKVTDIQSYNKLSIENDEFKNFFRPSTDDIVTHIQSILSEVSHVDLILLVGGFSTSGYVSRVIMDAFPDKRVVVPLQAEVAVMYGAVLCGFEPLVISSRVCRHTYGIDVFEDFREGYHQSRYKEMIDGSPCCVNVFSVLVKEGEAIGTSETRKRTYSSTHRDEDRRYLIMEVPVFASKNVCPIYTTEGSCVALGRVQVEPPADGWPLEVHYTVHMFFGQTEFKVVVTNDVSGQEYNASFDCLK
ncbi:heat shock 70 kDa protein 12A-like [Mizuhopecten yessoensis]|uniref:heat shock 70 kDa protein 12A-like n=1 Tax=Mizuhopecten yessoensis TaxID=6573 RepID=UPI000B459486|nr:heat shock 70 kDa protein 12A-like [Mizuhopecten yessoensis]